MADPSHAAGHADLVPALAEAALAAGAQGLLVETVARIEQRQTALCDGPQGILPDTLSRLVARAAPAQEHGGRGILPASFVVR